MSLFQSMFGIGRRAAPITPVPIGETDSVRRIAARLGALPAERARFVAAFAYLLARAARADIAITDIERAEMARIIAQVGQLDAETAGLVAELAGTRVEHFGATDDYLVTREFKAISTLEEREQLLHCCLLVAVADDTIDARESWLVNRLAEELDVPRPDLNRIREAFTDRIAGIAEVRRMREERSTTSSQADPPATRAPDAASAPDVAPPPAPDAAPASTVSQAAPDLPPGVRIDPVWLVEVPYTAEARERRPAYRVEHLARLARLRTEGVVIEAGGAADFSKAVLLMRGADEAEIRAVIESDAYTGGRVWEGHKATIVGYGRVVTEP